MVFGSMLAQSAEGVVSVASMPSVRSALGLGLDVVRDGAARKALILVGEWPSEERLEAHVVALFEGLDHPGLYFNLAAQDVLRGDLGIEARFEEAGQVEGAGRIERIYALVHPDLPPLPPKARSGNVRLPPRSIVGRRREIDELQYLAMERPLVTLVGPPAVGKTTLARLVAGSLVAEMPDGVWWFEGARSVDDLLVTIAREPGLVSLAGVPTVERIAAGLIGKTCVFFLDGCESIAGDVAGVIEELLNEAPGLSIVATSTRPIGIGKERIMRIQPLDVETGDGGSESEKLFFTRAEEAGVVLVDDESSGLIAQVCTMLEGVPLAIEFAAASLSGMSLADLHAALRVDSLLGQSGLTRAAHAALTLLSREEQELLRRLTMIEGSWDSAELRRLGIWKKGRESLESIHRSLVAQSWIAAEPGRREFRLLRPVRDFLRKRLRPQAAALRAHHEALVPYFGELTGAYLDGAPGATASASRNYGRTLSFMFEALRERRDFGLVSEALRHMVFIWLDQHRLDDAETVCRAFLEAGAEGRDEVRCWMTLGVVQLRRHHLDDAERSFAAARDHSRATGFGIGEAVAVNNLAMVSSERGDADEAERLFALSAQMAREQGAFDRVADFLSNAVHHLLLYTPNPPDSATLSACAALLDEARRYVGNAAGQRQALAHNEGELALALGMPSEAASHFLRALELCAKAGMRHEASQGTGALAFIFAERGEHPTAAKLLGLAVRLWRESGMTVGQKETIRLGKTRAMIGAAIGADHRERLMRFGAAMKLEEVLFLKTWS